MINFQCLNLESGRWPHSKLAKLLNFQQIICWWLISELVCWCLNEMAHIITCGCCGKTWPLVSSCGICIYSFMRLRTYTILGEQLGWCWTICNVFFCIHCWHIRVCTSGDTLLRDNCQLIGMPLIVLAQQAQKNRDQSDPIGPTRKT